MNTSKRINWTRIVPPLLTALLVSCSLLSGKTQRSEQCRLTAKAYTATFADTSTFNILSSQWDYQGSTTLNKNFSLVGDGTSNYNVYQISFASTYSGNDDLVWGVDIYDSSGNTILYFGAYIDVGQVLVIGLPTVTPSQYSQYTDIVYRCHLYVKKKDGSTIYRDYMNSSNFTWYFNRTEDIEQSTLPNEWLQSTAATTTSPFSTMTTISSDLIPDDQMIEQNLTTPPWIEGAVAQLLALVSQLIQLRYIRFILGFVIIISLVAWFLH